MPTVAADGRHETSGTRSVASGDHQRAQQVVATEGIVQPKSHRRETERSHGARDGAVSGDHARLPATRQKTGGDTVNNTTQ
jgi:hypothetical protein